MSQDELDLTPDPKVLVALTATPLQPLDALCELIDNAIDSFEHAKRAGNPIAFPLIVVDIPGTAELERGAGIVRVRDNGPGLTLVETQNALRAGYSGKQRYGSLGLFGMGFNIATGKLGRRTTFSTVRENDSMIQVEINLPKMIEAGTYKVPFNTSDAPADFQQGTKVEIDSWWPQSSQNHGFVRKLAAYPKNQVRAQLGRRYATVLRENRIRIHVNGEPCTAFEHCTWDKERFVERVGRGKIPAQFRFDDVVNIQTRCVECDQIIEPGQKACPVPTCKSQSFRTLEERIRGWVGIQRFDDQTNFGIDLIRNGRAIRVAEKAAFFEYTDDFNVTTKDYPIDSPFGRIVGEVHLDHVAVDYTKQDFERNTDEWRRAMAFIRGESSLQPSQPNADANTSPIFKLYQGYRRVRTAGTRDMYMGYYDQGKPKRISRDVEKDYYQKFAERLPGFYDDLEWWKLVLQADTPPAAELVICPNIECGATNVKGADVCAICTAVLIGKDCIKCNTYIAASALSCPVCGASQLPEVISPWRCEVCDEVNPHEAELCIRCGSVQAAQNSASKDFLALNSDRDDSLSALGLTIPLADGSTSGQIDVRTYISRQYIMPKWGAPRVPSIAFRAADSIDIFIDTSHRLYSALHVQPELTVAEEAADFILQLNARLIATYPAQHSLCNLTSSILDQLFSGVLEDNRDKVVVGAKMLFDGIRFQLSRCPAEETSDLFETLSEEQSKALAASMMSHYSIDELGSVTKSSAFLGFIDDNTVVDIFRRRPRLFFDGRVFTARYDVADVAPHLVAAAQAQMSATYLNCLEDLAQYLRNGEPTSLQTQRARASLELLQSNFE